MTAPVNAQAGDIRSAIRTLRRAPGFSTVVVATLAPGIWANTATCSIIRAPATRVVPAVEPARRSDDNHSLSTARNNFLAARDGFSRARVSPLRLSESAIIDPQSATRRSYDFFRELAGQTGAAGADAAVTPRPLFSSSAFSAVRSVSLIVRQLSIAVFKSAHVAA